jgi:hypothetical protein
MRDESKESEESERRVVHKYGYRRWWTRVGVSDRGKTTKRVKRVKECAMTVK